jgi:cytoskeletal protein RodZ
MAIKSEIIDKTSEAEGGGKGFNPFPGLRPFKIEESHLFFGREGQSEEVLDNLSKNRFVGVIGSSGSGKSSLMYCGLVPILHGGFITEAGSKWKIVASRPGSAPIDNLAESISRNELPDADEETFKVRHAITQSILKSSSNGLVETIRHMDKKPDENVLILIDQFEELFRFRKNNNTQHAYNEAVAFVKLLLTAVYQKEEPIYIVLTMRSDFIGECSQFQELTKLINDSHYLIPQMTRRDITQAIEGPIAVGGGTISHQLVQRLLNDIGDKQDQLPILQHALMRTWEYWTKFSGNNEPTGTTHYEAIGAMEKALSDHANEAFDELTEREKEICESIFKSLTERGSDNKGVRRPSRLDELANIAQASEAEVVNVINTFRKSGRSFLTTSAGEINSESIIDISHESLMRIWIRLITWVEEEANAVQLYVRLSNAAALHQEGKAGLWRPPDLHLATNWRQKQKPSVTWAKRYAVEFERTMLFLENSEAAYDAEERNKVKLQKKALKRSRTFAIAMGIASIFLLGILVWAFMQYIEADTQRKKADSALAEADVQRNLAVANAEEAEKNALEAERNAEVAMDAQKEAELKRKEAEIATENATKSAREAKRQSRIAKNKAEEARRALIQAEENRKEAEEQRAEANKNANTAREAKKDADKLRMLSISKSMAIKSQQIRRDLQEKGLMAFQAYRFNENYGGDDHQSDVYGGLYDAAKSLKPSKFTQMEEHTAAVRSIKTIGENSYLSAGSDGQIIRWDNDVPRQIATESEIIRRIAVDSGRETFATASESGKISVYKSSGDSVMTELLGHQGATIDIAFMGRNHIVSVGVDSLVYVWNLTTGNRETLDNKGEQIRNLTVSADNSLIVGGCNSGNLILWDVGDNKDGSKLSLGITNPVTSVSFNTKGDRMAVGDMSGMIRILDAKGDFSIMYTEVGHTARITDIAYSKDDKFMASAGLDGTVRLFLTEDYDLAPIVMNDHIDWVWTVSFSDDGKTLYSGSMNNVIQKFPTDTEQLAELMCPLLTRNMSKDEWDKYVAPDIPFEKTCEKK